MKDDHHRYRKTRQSFNEPGQAHEITFSCYKRLKLLAKERTCLWFLEALDDARKKYQFELWAYVLMPEHAHILILPLLADYRIDAMPFGGVKGSGLGREGVAFAAREMTTTKVVCLNL